MRRLGISENTIMAISGWKSAAMFRRYNITYESDMKEASRIMAERRKKLASEFGENPTRSKVGQIDSVSADSQPPTIN